MEGCFMFQWGVGRGLFFTWGAPHGGALVLVGGASKKIVRWGDGAPLLPHAPPDYGKP